MNIRNPRSEHRSPTLISPPEDCHQSSANKSMARLKLSRWNAVRTLLATLAFTSILAGCGGGNDSTPPATPPAPPPVVTAATEVPNEVVRASISPTSAKTIIVPSSAPALAGTSITIPMDAAIDDSEVQVGYENAPPAPFRAEAVTAGAKPVSKTMVVKVGGGKPSTFNKLVTITMPYDKVAAGDLPPAVFYWDPDASRYRSTAVISVDRANGKVTFQTSHFSSFIAAVVTTLGVSMPDVDTGFKIGTDSILHPNFGSYQFGGHCAAFASLSTHYYGMKKAKPLYTLAQEGAIEQPVDDELTRSALTLSYTLISQKWAGFASGIVKPSAVDTGLLMLASMIITGDPLHLVMHSNNNKDGGHSVTAYAYDKTSKQFKIYDSNFPKNEVTFGWDVVAGFGTYSRAASYPTAMFDYIGYASDDTFGAPAQFQKIIGDWETGKLKDYFSTLQITDDTGAVQQLAYGTSVTTKLQYLDNQAVSGKFNRPAGSGTKPVYLHVYFDGVPQTAVAPQIDASGIFSVSFPTKLENKVNVMLLVSEHPRDTGNGFSGFAKFSVSAEGKNFFTNFGFETGDTAGWNGATSLLNNGAAFTPTKISVTGIGFDPIATDIPTAVFGNHAVRINDETPDYHKSYIAQTAKVPASGNPQLLFQWAAVLEDPQHDPDDQPYIEVTVINKTKGIDLYRKRFYTNDPNFNGWKDYQGGSWKAIPWQSVVLTGLSAHAGDQVELRIDGVDCGLGGHGGYVYLDGEE